MDKKMEERFALAAKVVSLVEGCQREFSGNSFFGGINWNSAVVNGFTDAFGDLILRDIFGSPKASVRNPEHVRIANERIQLLFEQHRMLVAELELSGLRYET